MMYVKVKIVSKYYLVIISICIFLFEAPSYIYSEKIRKLKHLDVCDGVKLRNNSWDLIR